MPKVANMTRQTLLMFPHMKKVTEDAKMAASTIASGATPERHGFTLVGRGAFTSAYANKQYVVKGTEVSFGDKVNTAAWNYRTWFLNTYKARHTSKMFAKACREFLAPTVVLMECVVIQERLPLMGKSFSLNLALAVEDLAWELGISDMHIGNWGMTAEGEVKIFDIMPIANVKGQAYLREDRLAAKIHTVRELAQAELKKLQLKAKRQKARQAKQQREDAALLEQLEA